MARVVGVDIGGTYTDIVVVDDDQGTLNTRKVATTVEDPSVGLLSGLAKLVDGPDIELFVHATTVATNAVLERRGGKCGLITTRGFRDILELRRRDRPHAYGLTGSFEPLIPRNLRLEVTERITAEGEIHTSLNENDVRQAASVLAEHQVQAIVVCFLNSYRNPQHELQAKAVVERACPNVCVVTSTEVLPVIREFERTSTAVVNAYVQPVLARYLGRLRGQLRDSGYERDLLVMQSTGGVVESRIAEKTPVTTVLSGPAAGVIAAARIGAASGLNNLICYDMGGTSLDVSLVIDGHPAVKTGTELEFGIPVMISMLDIHTLGAGGGSVAHLDDRGLLQIGPESAGASPGPVCYGLGGKDPTVTDANVILGRINSGNPISRSGDSLDTAAAQEAIAAHIAAPLELSVEAAADAILAVASNRIAGGVRHVTIRRGHDPRDFVLFAFGGSGPLFVCPLLRELEIPRALIPLFPGMVSAWGCVCADLRHDFVTTVNRCLSEVEITELEALASEHMDLGNRQLDRAGLPTEIAVVREADMCYEGQTHVIRTPLSTGAWSAEDLASSFRQAFRNQYGQTSGELRELESLLQEVPIRLLSLRTSVIGVRPERPLHELLKGPGTDLPAAFLGRRRVWFDGHQLDCPTYERSQIPWGSEFSGPAVIEQADTTTWLEPGARACVDECGNLLVEVQ